MQKGKKVFNIIIAITIIALISVGGYAAYYYISNYIELKEAEKAVDEFENNVIVVNIEDKNIQEEPTQTEEPEDQGGTSNSTTKRTSSGSYYRGYSMIGTIQIPKTKVKIPIVDKATPASMKSAAAVIYGPGLNEVGNTVIAAHNYRNGTYFSNNKKLVVGDKIYITDSSGDKLEYTIYKTYTVDATEFSYATRDTQGKREISLSTCTTDPEQRLVILARES